MPSIVFDEASRKNEQISSLVQGFLDKVVTLEQKHDASIFVFQDGVNNAYYIKCTLLASDVVRLCDLDAKLDSNTESYRANRKLFLTHTTYKRMESDAKSGREFNDIIVEYNVDYNKDVPLKVWGGQHRVKAISNSGKSDRYHGFRIYFDLTKLQRTDVALISNTNISVSNDTFDRIIEDTVYGGNLRKWCKSVGFLHQDEDFPDVGSRSEKITVKKARSFIVNYYLGKKRGQELNSADLDRKIYEPYLAETGIKAASEIASDSTYNEIMNSNNILEDKELFDAGKNFLLLHNAQYKAVTDPKNKNLVPNNKGFRNKAFVESVLCGWSYVAGLLQSHPQRLINHYHIPKVTARIPDPLNAVQMSKYKHDRDKETYRGLGTRSAIADRQRVAQLFLAKSLDTNVCIDEALMNKAVNQVIGLSTLSGGYA